MFSIISRCRICGSSQLTKYLDLGALPLANGLVDPRKTATDLFFPLQVLFCGDCALSQLSIAVDPRLLFSEYAYRSSISSTFQEHFAALAREIEKLFPATEECLVLDIASNDGCLLEEFKKRGFRVLGVEPAANLVPLANRRGLHTIEGFWGGEVVEKVVKEHGRPRVITATNVFAHVHDVRGFLQCVKQVLHPEGILVIEVPHALNLITKNEFDTIYHEHLSYFLVKPLLALFEKEGMKVCDIQQIPIHGGSIRIFATVRASFPVNTPAIRSLLDAEKKEGLYELERYQAFAQAVLDTKIAFLQLLARLKRDGKTVAGYGAAAKASTLLHYSGVGTDHIPFIADDAPTKQNRALSGNRIPIVPSSRLQESPPDYLVIFAWAIAPEIITKTKGSFHGKYIIPLPFPRIVEDTAGL